MPSNSSQGKHDSIDPANVPVEKDSSHTNQQVTGFVVRGKISEPEGSKPRRKKTSVEPAPIRIPTEAELREEAAWKQVEETGKPVILDGMLLIPDGMTVWQAMELLLDGIREDAKDRLTQKLAGIWDMLLDSAKNQNRERAKARGDLEKYDALHPIGKLALAELVVRKQMNLPEVPIEEIVDRLQTQYESNDKPQKKPKPTKTIKRPQPVQEFTSKPPPTLNSVADSIPRPASLPSVEHQESIKLSQVSQWNLEHHGLLLKRLDQIWKYLTGEEQQTIRNILDKKIGPDGVNQIDEIIKASEWMRNLDRNHGWRSPMTIKFTNQVLNELVLFL